MAERKIGRLSAGSYGGSRDRNPQVHNHPLFLFCSCRVGALPWSWFLVLFRFLSIHIICIQMIAPVASITQPPSSRNGTHASYRRLSDPNLPQPPTIWALGHSIGLSTRKVGFSVVYECLVCLSHEICRQLVKMGCDWRPSDLCANFPAILL